MSEIIKLKFVRPVKVQFVENKGRKIKINGINRDGGEFGAERSYGSHKGLDFLSYKWRVEASGTGIVVYSGFIPGSEEATDYGNTVIIEHTTKAGEYDKYVYTLYAHLEEKSILRGTKVESGYTIGTTSNIGTEQYYYHKRTNKYPDKDPEVETAPFEKCQKSERTKSENKGETVGTDKVYNRCKAITQYETTGGYHLHFEVIVSPRRIDWNTDAWPRGNTFRVNPETVLAEGVEVKYTETEREVTDADRKKFGERLRIVRRKDGLGNLVSDTVWIGKRYAGRLNIDTNEIELDIPMTDFFAITDGPKPMRRQGDARFDVEVNA